MEIEAPLVAKHAKAGQFIILRTDKDGERIPLTIADYSRERGSVTVIFQKIGATTARLALMEENEYLEDFAGPLGNPTKTEGIKKVCIVGGGVGCAIALPVAREFARLDADVTSIIGFRNSDLVILKDEFEKVSQKFVLVTDDGSAGEQGNVTMPLAKILESGENFDEIITIGPLVMMKFVTETARKFGVPVTVSMNPIMIDGTGMCGGCRLSLIKDGKRQTRFACVDGPDFNGYEVDFDEAILRNRAYCEFERHAFDKHCNLLKKEAE